MGKFRTNAFLLVVVWNLWSCSNAINELHGCECNIMDACDAQGNPKSNWAQYLPSGVNNFGYVVQGAQKLAYLCENRTVAILFDRNSRIPLYAATVMTGQQLSASGQPRPKKFRQSTKVDIKYQQKEADYKKRSQRVTCVEKQATGKKENDKKWAASAKKATAKKAARKKAALKPSSAGKKAVAKQGSAIVCKAESETVPIHIGHLIASQYGKGDKQRMLATFTYTNTVPQFGLFNSGPWQQCESNLVNKWGQNNCATGTQNVKLFIVVGAIPSTVDAPLIPGEPRFFGKGGFSNYQDNDDYPVNVPKLLWTAACCTFEYKDYQGNLQTGTKSTAFQRENDPGDSPCNKMNIPTLTTFLSGFIHGNINLFPLSPQCNSNYIPLQC
ncbi:uncharacterized protein LOC144642334 [Oculina patagonica]